MSENYSQGGDMGYLFKDTSIEEFQVQLEWRWVTRSSMKVVFENKYGGAIHGRGAERLHQIEKLTGTKIEIDKAREGHRLRTHRDAIILGETTSVERALFLLHVCVNMLASYFSSHLSLEDAVMQWQANKAAKSSARMDSNQNIESGYDSNQRTVEAELSVYSTELSHFPIDQTCPVYDQRDFQSRIQRLRLNEQPRISDSVSAIYEARRNQRRRSIETPTIEPSFVEPPVVEPPVVQSPVLEDLVDQSVEPVEHLVDTILLELQKYYPSGIFLDDLQNLLEQPRQYQEVISSELLTAIISLGTLVNDTSLLETLKTNEDYVHITEEGLFHVRFSKFQGDDDFETRMINDSAAADAPFDANDKISMAIEEYAIRMVAVFKDNYRQKSFTDKEFTDHLNADDYAVSILRFLHDYLKYFFHLRVEKIIDKFPEFVVLQNERSALHIHCLNTINYFQLKDDRSNLWRIIARESSLDLRSTEVNSSMYSDYFKRSSGSIELRDSNLLQIMRLKENEQLVSPKEFADWYKEFGFGIFKDNIQTMTANDGEDFLYYNLVKIKNIQSCVAVSVEIVDDEVSAMKKDLEQEIEAFVDENDFKLAKGQDGFKAAGLFPYLVEGREHLIKRGQLLIYNGAYKERCMVIDVGEDDHSNVLNQDRSYFARHSPSSLQKKRSRTARRSREKDEFAECKNVKVFYLDYGHPDTVPVSDLYFASRKFLKWPLLSVAVTLYNYKLDQEMYREHNRLCKECGNHQLECYAYDFWERKMTSEETYRMRLLENSQPDEWTTPPLVVLQKSTKKHELLKLNLDVLTAWVNTRATFGDNHTVSLEKHGKLPNSSE